MSPMSHFHTSNIRVLPTFLQYKINVQPYNNRMNATLLCALSTYDMLLIIIIHITSQQRCSWDDKNACIVHIYKMTNEIAVLHNRMDVATSL